MPVPPGCDPAEFAQSVSKQSSLSLTSREGDNHVIKTRNQGAESSSAAGATTSFGRLQFNRRSRSNSYDSASSPVGSSSYSRKESNYVDPASLNPEMLRRAVEQKKAQLLHEYSVKNANISNDTDEQIRHAAMIVHEMSLKRIEKAIASPVFSTNVVQDFLKTSCHVCFREKGAGGKFCWNEGCTASPIFYKLSGARGAPPPETDIPPLLLPPSCTVAPSSSLPYAHSTPSEQLSQSDPTKFLPSPFIPQSYPVLSSCDGTSTTAASESTTTASTLHSIEEWCEGMDTTHVMDVERKARSDSGLTDTDGLYNDSPPGNFSIPCKEFPPSDDMPFLPPAMLPLSSKSSDDMDCDGSKKRFVDVDNDGEGGTSIFSSVEKRGRKSDGDHLSLLFLSTISLAGRF